MARTFAISLWIPLIIALGWGMTTRVLAEELESENLKELVLEGEHCVSLMRIDHTDVIDDSNILFYMKGGDVYLNRLPHRCPGLRWEKAFMYRTSIGRLCDLDIITILNNMGFGFSPGASCGLGMFLPISKETALQLKEQRKKGH